MNNELEIDLSEFYGTVNWYRHPLFRTIVYTDGVKYIADKCEAYWLIDELAGLTTTLQKQHSFLVFKLEVAQNKGILTITDGDDNFVQKKTYIYTDFPLDTVMIWATNNTLLLPSEY